MTRLAATFIAAVAIGGVTAQYPSDTSSSSVSDTSSSTMSMESSSSSASSMTDDDYVTLTVYISSCSESVSVTAASSTTGMWTSTETSTIIETYCPKCSNELTAAPKPGVFTTYTTVFSTWCPTGLAPATYTITEPCPATGLPRADHTPSGFTVKTEACPVCPHPTTAVITCPIATPTPSGGTAPAQAPMETPAPAMVSSMMAPAPMMPSGGAAPPAPEAPPSFTVVASNSSSPGCPGSAYCSGGASNSTSAPMPNPNSASSLSLNGMMMAFSSGTALLVATFAFVL